MATYDYYARAVATGSRLVPSSLPKHGNGVVRVKTPPVVEPVTLDEVKLFGRIDGSDEDLMIDGLIRSARVTVENFLKKALIDRVLVLSLDWWPEPVLELPMPPLMSVVEVRTVGEDGTVTVYDSASYFVRTEPTPGQIVIRDGCTPPINTDRYYGGYEVEYHAGYSADPADVPESIRTGLMLLVVHCYEFRTPVVTGGAVMEVPGLKDLLGMERRIRL